MGLILCIDCKLSSLLLCTAGEVALGKSSIEVKSEAAGDDLVNITGSRTEALRRWKNENHNEISTRLQHLELELSLTLDSLKSKSKELNLKEVEICIFSFSKLLMTVFLASLFFL